MIGVTRKMTWTIPKEYLDQVKKIIELESEIDSLKEEVERLRNYCNDYAEMTGITLNVPDEMREKFFKALEDK